MKPSFNLVKSKQTEADTIYLTEYEVWLLHDLYSVEQSDSLALFLLGCYSGKLREGGVRVMGL